MTRQVSQESYEDLKDQLSESENKVENLENQLSEDANQIEDLKDQLSEKKTFADEVEDDLITDTFSPDEYEKLQELIYSHPELMLRLDEYKNEIHYLRMALNTSLENIQQSLQSIQQRNTIEFREKSK